MECQLQVCKCSIYSQSPHLLPRHRVFVFVLIFILAHSAGAGLEIREYILLSCSDPVQFISTFAKTEFPIRKALEGIHVAEVGQLIRHSCWCNLL